MENIKKEHKWLGVVTLFKPDMPKINQNIHTYKDYLDELIIWDNTPGISTNDGIAKPLNVALHKALTENYDMLLIMDQDSSWKDFECYKNDIEKLYKTHPYAVFTPHIFSLDKETHMEKLSYRRLFINSGTVIPVSVLKDIGEADENAFPLDALDNDMSFRLRQKGYEILCLGEHELFHKLGNTKRLGPFNMFTPDYNSYRTWSITRSHIICYRKHHKIMTAEDKNHLFREILLMKFIRILLAESNKTSRMKAFIKGIFDGCTYKIK